MACEGIGAAFRMRNRRGLPGVGEAAVLDILSAAHSERAKLPAARVGGPRSRDSKGTASNIRVSASACDVIEGRNRLQSENNLGDFETKRLAFHFTKEDNASRTESRRPSGGIRTEPAMGVGFHMDPGLEWRERTIGCDH